MSDSFDTGSIHGGIDWDVSGFFKGMLQVQTITHEFPSLITSFIANPLLGIVGVAEAAADGIKEAFRTAYEGGKRYVETAREIALADDEAAISARSLGMTITQFAGLAGAAKLVGLDVGGMTDSLNYLNRSMGDASRGNLQLRREFWELGVSISDGAGNLRKPLDVFYDLADAIGRLPNAQLQAKYAMDLLSRGGMQMIPILKGGSGSLRELYDEMVRFHALPSQADADIGERFRRMQWDWGLLWQGLERDATRPLRKFVSNHFEDIQKEMFKFQGWADKALDFGFKWILDHQDEISGSLQTLGVEGEKALAWGISEVPKVEAEIKKLWGELIEDKNWFVRNWPEIRAEFVKLEHEAIKLAPIIGEALLGAAILSTSAKIVGLIKDVGMLTGAFGAAEKAAGGFFSALTKSLSAGVAAGGVAYAVDTKLGVKGHEREYGAAGAGVGAAIGSFSGPAGAIGGGLIGNGVGRIVGRHEDTGQGYFSMAHHAWNSYADVTAHAAQTARLSIGHWIANGWNSFVSDLSGSISAQVQSGSITAGINPSPQSSAPKITNNITITVPPGTDAKKIADVTAKAVADVHKKLAARRAI